MSVKLVLDFVDANSDNVRLSYNYIKSDVSTNTVRNLVAAIINNGSIFAKVPVAAKSAKLVTTTETEVDLAD